MLYRVHTIADAVATQLDRAGVAHRIQWAGSMFSVFFRDGEVRDYAGAQDQDTAAFGRFFHGMLRRGVHLPPSAFETWFVSAAMDDEAVEAILSALPGAVGDIG